MTTHTCRFCGGERPHNGKICLGCGTPLAKCQTVDKDPRKKLCPVCDSPGPHTCIAFQRYRCQPCGATIEQQDFNFVDTRPLENAMKKERQEKYEAKRALNVRRNAR